MDSRETTYSYHFAKTTFRARQYHTPCSVFFWGGSSLRWRKARAARRDVPLGRLNSSTYHTYLVYFALPRIIYFYHE